MEPAVSRPAMPFDVGTLSRDPVRLLEQLEAERPALLATVATRLDGFRIPGGDVAAWLAGVPSVLIAGCLDGDRATAARRLFHLVGRVGTAGRPDLVDGLLDDSLTNVPCGATAGAALQAWAGCLIARLHLEAGNPEAARRSLRTFAVTLAGLRLTPAAARHFDARLRSLDAEIEAALIGSLTAKLVSACAGTAHEVA